MSTWTQNLSLSRYCCYITARHSASIGDENARLRPRFSPRKGARHVQAAAFQTVRILN